MSGGTSIRGVDRLNLKNIPEPLVNILRATVASGDEVSCERKLNLVRKEKLKRIPEVPGM